jgi:hypothetical protein
LVSNCFNLWKAAAECYSPLNPTVGVPQFTLVSNRPKSAEKGLVFAPTSNDSPPERPAPVPVQDDSVKTTSQASSDSEEEKPAPQIVEIMKENIIEAGELIGAIGKPPSRPPPTPRKEANVN